MASLLPRATPRHWVYLDAERTHELHAQFAATDVGSFLVTTEFPAGSRDAGEVVHAQTPVRGEAELIALLGEIEARLALTGRYYRAEAGGPRWTPVVATLPKVDLRAQEAPIPGREVAGAKMRFHHFHGGEGDDRLLISMPRPDVEARHVLAQLRFQFPRVDAGELEILHARLAPSVLASAVAREHIEAPRKGLAKLAEPRDYERAYGSSWRERARGMLSRAAARLVGGHAPAPPPREAPIGAPARLEEMRAALGSDRVEALKLRFVDPVTEARLVEAGEHAIRKYVNGLRRKASHQLSYELSMLEAALLAEYAIPAQMWDLATDEGGKLLRYLHGYA